MKWTLIDMRMSLVVDGILRRMPAIIRDSRGNDLPINALSHQIKVRVMLLNLRYTSNSFLPRCLTSNLNFCTSVSLLTFLYFIDLHGLSLDVSEVIKAGWSFFVTQLPITFCSLLSVSNHLHRYPTGYVTTLDSIIQSVL